MYDFAVIGGGLHGLSVALQLARRAQRVVIIERDWCGRHASGATAAGVRTLGRNIAELPLSLRSMEMWRDIRALVDDDCGFHANGQIQAAACGDDFERIRIRVAGLQSGGYQNERIIDQKDLRKLVPGINPALVGGAFAEGDGAADPHRTIKAFRRAALRAGCDIREQTAVFSLNPASGGWELGTSGGCVHAGGVINAAGAWGARIAGLAGEHIPFSAKAPMMMVTEPVGPLVRQVIGIMGRNLSFKQTDRGGLVIGGGLPGNFDLESGKSTVNFGELPKAARAAKELFSNVGSVRIVRAWAGIEGMTADRLPVIGPSSMTGLWHVFGFSGHGFQLVPAVGELVADMALSGEIHPLLNPFNTYRLSNGERPANLARTEGAAARPMLSY